MMRKSKLLSDLHYCEESLRRITEYARINYTESFDCKHTVIQNDIIKLRRELNEIRQELGED